MRRLATLAVVAALMSSTVASGQHTFGDWARDLRIPKPSRRFSLRFLMLATAVVALGLAVYVSKAQFKVVALLIVSDVRPMSHIYHKAPSDYDYDKVLASIFEKLQSDAVIRDAVQNTAQGAISVDEIRSRLDVRQIGNSELVGVSLRGREFRDDKALFTSILEGMLQRCVEEFTGDVIEVKIRRSPTIR